MPKSITPPTASMTSGLPHDPSSAQRLPSNAPPSLGNGLVHRSPRSPPDASEPPPSAATPPYGSNASHDPTARAAGPLSPSRAVNRPPPPPPGGTTPGSKKEASRQLAPTPTSRARRVSLNVINGVKGAAAAATAALTPSRRLSSLSSLSSLVSTAPPPPPPPPSDLLVDLGPIAEMNSSAQGAAAPAPKEPKAARRSMLPKPGAMSKLPRARHSILEGVAGLQGAAGKRTSLLPVSRSRMSLLPVPAEAAKRQPNGEPPASKVHTMSFAGAPPPSALKQPWASSDLLLGSGRSSDSDRV